MASSSGGGAAAESGFWAILTSPSPLASTARTAIVAAVAAGAVYVATTSSSTAKSRDRDRDAKRLPPPPPTPQQPQLPQPDAGASAAAERQEANRTRRGDFARNAVAIFWDVDNCAPPTGSSGRNVALAIRKAVQSIGDDDAEDGNLRTSGPIISFKAYLELSTSETTSPAQVELRSELQGSGVTLIDTPKSGRKDVADKMMIADLLSFAIDTPPPARIALLSGDRDFAYPLGILRNRGYEVILITPPVGAVPILEASANAVLRWRQDVLGMDRDGNGRLYASKKPWRESTPTAATAVNGQDKSSASKATETKPAAAAKSHSSHEIPPVFQPLVALLEQMRKEGYPKPLRSSVAARLIGKNKDIYEKAGASRWADYAAVAEAAGVITLGGTGVSGHEWVALRAVAPPVPGPIPPAVFSANGRANGTNASSAAHNALQPAFGSSPSKPSSAPLMAKSTSNPGTKPEKLEITVFYPLIEVIKEHRASGNPRPLASMVAHQLATMQKQGIVDTYSRAGVKTFKEYIALASQAGVARTHETDVDGVHWVEVLPKYAELHTGQITGGSVTRMIDTAGSVRESAQPEATSGGVEARSASPTKLAAKLAAPGKALATLMRGKGSKDDLIVDAEDDPTKKGQLQPHNPSGELISPLYFPLTNLLNAQRREGKYYSADNWCHKILASHHKIGPMVKSTAQWNVYLARAERDQIITLEQGFKPGFQHVRLNPRLCVNRAVVGAVPDSPRTKQAALFAPASPPRTSSKGTPEGSTRSSEESSISALPPPQAQLQALQPTTTLKLVETPSQPVVSADRSRFKPLLDTLISIRKETGERDTSTGRLGAELVKRFPLPDNASATPGMWYQAHNASGVRDYLTQASAKDFVELYEEHDDKKGGPTGRLVVRLAPKFADIFFPSS